MRAKGVNNNRRVKTFLIFFFSGVLLLLALLIGFSKKPELSSEDIVYIKDFLKDWNISTSPSEVHKSFECEIAFISRIQDSILAEVHHQTVEQSAFGNVGFYYKNRKGECYDRAVLLEKFFLYFNFDFRHIFVYYLNNNKDVAFADFFKKGTGSHALTEVKTSRGWMAMGSNADWIGLHPNGQIFSMAELKDELYKNGDVTLKEQPYYGIIFWKQHPRFKYIYGVYSRHGEFLPPRHTPIPDYNFKMLLYNL